MLLLLSGHAIRIGDLAESLQQSSDRQQLSNAELQDALAWVKTLRGLLPICANCKRVRDDKGYWQGLEVYVREHSDAEFSHGICPACSRELYPEFTDR